jgi:hypothetical protein
MNQAWVVAVDMGYGHQRAAYPFRDIAYERIITANTDDCVTPEERRLWEAFQGFYESVSRAHNIPLIGPWLWKAYDRLQAISPHYPFLDESKASFGSMRLQKLIGRGFGGSVTAYTRRREELPLLTTFYAVALAADLAGRRDVFCVVTDSDVNRVWVAEDPKRSRVHYLAPTPLSRVRLLRYGVPEERIFVTGFPLPEENVATAGKDVASRLAVLDANGVLRARYQNVLQPSVLAKIPESAARPLSVTFAVGGAGAQAGMVRDILASLAGALLKDGRMRLNLVAGVREGVRDHFFASIRECGLEAELTRSIRMLFTPTKDEYFGQFNLLLRETDVLWTKPSELAFYAALGIPIVMCPPLGAHEERNRALLVAAGAGHDQLHPRAAAEWLSDGVQSGLLAKCALNGLLHLQNRGTENIKRVLFAPDRSKVELLAEAPVLGEPLPAGS